MAGNVHPTAVIEPGAELHETVRVGAFAVIGERVRLGPACDVQAHAVILGDTVLGAENVVCPHAVLGGPPQIRDLAGQAGRLRLGSGNVFRELCTVHAGRPGGETVIGDGNLFMVGSHVAHDCRIGSRIEMANGVQLAGHVGVGDGAGLGGLAAAHQFVRIGAHAFVAAGALISQDVPPYSLAAGDRARVFGLNGVGLRRAGFSIEQRRLIGRALRLLLRAPTLKEGLEQLAGLPASVQVQILVDFAASSSRGLCRLAGRGVDAEGAG